MELIDRHRYAELAWFEPDAPEFPGITIARPLCLGTKAAMEIMGLRLLEEDHGLTPDEEMKQILLYLWLHSAPVAQITGSLWDGSWLAFGASQEPPIPAVIAEMRTHLERVRLATQASMIALKSPPPSKWDNTPADVIGLRDPGWKIAVIAQSTGWHESHIQWKLWLPKALQIYHAELRRRNYWTIAPGRPTNEADFTPEALTPDWMKGQAFTVPPIDTGSES